MSQVKAYAAPRSNVPLEPFQVDRRDPEPHDVAIEVLYCGVCHSDLHQVRDEWGHGIFPMVPGHEIIGRVTAVGSAVTGHKAGDLVGVGCMVDSCRTCPSCQEGLEQYCEEGFVGTYNARERDGKTITYGGYSTHIVTDEAFVLRIPDSLDPAGAAPLLCAGITTYSPLRHWKVGKGDRVGVVGLGGLGHMAVKLAHAMGAEVTMFTTSPDKEADARHLGAHEVVISKDRAAMKQHARHFDFILNTVSAPHDINAYTALLRREGTMTLVGMPTSPPTLQAASLVFRRASIAGSLIGGIRETQEMLEFCAEHDIVSDVEIIAMDQINTAYERMLRSDVKYRFVIDMATLKA